MRILTTAEIRQAEHEAVARPGMSTLVLMQRAGTAVAQFCLAHFKFNSVCVVCGKGNNGGDGFVAAEALRPMVGELSVIVLASGVSGLSPDAATMCSRLGTEPAWVADEAGFDSDAVRHALGAELIIDAVVGTGFKPPLRGLAKRAVEAINDALGTVVALDLPSGVDADITRPAQQSDMVFAHGVVTFIAPKPAHVFGELTSGPIVVSEIGAQPALVPNETKLNAITGQEVGIAFPPRPRDSNKGLFGHVLVVAGSLGKAGAAALAGRAALSTGAGLVTVACPRSIQATVAGFAAEIMTEGLEETGEGSIAMSASARIERLLAGKDAVVLGPGLSRNQSTEEFARWLVRNCPAPLVLDADGLNAFDGRLQELKPSSTEKAPFRVLTPHPGEAARLLGVSIKEIQANRVDMAKRLSRETGSCVVLKGSSTVIAGLSDETWINMTGNPALAKGGSGDVLSGIVGAALARRAAGALRQEQIGGPGPRPPETWLKEVYGSDPREKERRWQARQLQRNAALAFDFLNDVSVASAVHLHGLAGDFAREMLHENTVLASDVVEHLSESFRDCEQQMEQGLFYLQK